MFFSFKKTGFRIGSVAEPRIAILVAVPRGVGGGWFRWVDRRPRIKRTRREEGGAAVVHKNENIALSPANKPSFVVISFCRARVQPAQHTEENTERLLSRLAYTNRRSAMREHEPLCARARTRKRINIYIYICIYALEANIG